MDGMAFGLPVPSPLVVQTWYTGQIQMAMNIQDGNL